MLKSPRWALMVGCLLAAAASPAIAAAGGGKVYALVIIDTRAPRLGEKLLRHDKTKIIDVLERFPEKARQYTLLEGSKATKTAILDYFRNLTVTKEDTVLFYFTGHGLTDKSDHVLQIFGSGQQERLRRAELRTTMRKCGARLTVLWTDACAAYADQGDHDPQDEGAKFAPDKIPVGFQRLFFETSGVVDINAAEEGTLAACDSKEGGIFTRTLWKHLDKNMDKADITWVGLYVQMKKDTERAFTQLKNDLAKKGKQLPSEFRTQKTQTAFAFYMPSATGMLVGMQRDEDRKLVGFRVTEVWAESPAQRAGLRRGEVITEMNGKAARTYKEYYKEIDDALASADKKLKLTVKDGDGNTREVTLDL